MDTIAQGMEYELEQQLYSYRQAHKALLWAKVQANDTAEQQRLDQLLMENETLSAQIQDRLNQCYKARTTKAMPRPPLSRNVWRAFLVGGLICTAGQVVILLMQELYAMDFRSASGIASVSVVVVTAILTGLGIYDEIGRFGGAGSIVPISGFSNSIVSAALEWKSSGMIYGIGAKIFTIAGPVILYGTMASVFLGLIYYALH